METLLPVVPHQQTETSVTSVSLRMLCLVRNAGHPVSQPPPAKPVLGSVLTSLILLHPNNVDCVVPANYRYFLFLFLVLYSLSYNSFLSSAQLCSSAKGNCPLHEGLKFAKMSG